MKSSLIVLVIILVGCLKTNDSKKTDQEITAPISTNTKNHIEESTCKLSIQPAKANFQDQLVFQVLEFNAQETVCWPELKAHGHSICEGRFPSRIKYIETDQLTADKSNALYPDFNTLKKYGLVEFTILNNDKGW